MAYKNVCKHVLGCHQGDVEDGLYDSCENKIAFISINSRGWKGIFMFIYSGTVPNRAPRIFHPDRVKYLSSS